MVFFFKKTNPTTSLLGAEIQSNLASFFVGHFNPNGSALIKETTWNTQQNHPGSRFRVSVKYILFILLFWFNRIWRKKIQNSKIWSEIKR